VPLSSKIVSRIFIIYLKRSTHIVDFEQLLDLETHIDYLSIKVLDSKYACTWIGESGPTAVAREDFDKIVKF
jgi:hypothetical protein